MADDPPDDGVVDERVPHDRLSVHSHPPPPSHPPLPTHPPAAVDPRGPDLLKPSLPVRRAAFSTVLLLVAASVVVGVTLDFRLGAYTLALALGVGTAARALLPPYLCLGLLVRSRVQDVITLAVLCVALAATAAVVPDR